MSTEKREGITERLKKELKSLLGIALYFWVLFTLFAFHKAILYGEHNILLQLGIALINSKLMAKVVFLGEHTRLGNRFEEKPLIYTILFKSTIFAIILFIFRVIEEILIGLWHGKTAYEALFYEHPRLGDGNATYAIAMACIIIFVALIPFFTYLEIEDALGTATLRGLLFKKSLSDFKNDRQIEVDRPSKAYRNPPENHGLNGNNKKYWYINECNEIIGPMSGTDCQKALIDGVIGCSTMVWAESWGNDWQELRNKLIVE
jgi:hypothetical protein